ETQGQGTSDIHEHVQNQEQQCLQSIDFYQDANKINRGNQSNERELRRKAVNNLIPETNNNLGNFNLNAQDQRLPNYINRTGQQPDRQFQHTQTTENIFLPRQAQQQHVTSTINLPKTQLKSFSGDPLRWHDWFSFFKATIHDNVTLTDAQRMTYLQNALTDRAKDSIIGYSYNGEFYNEAMQELQKRFGKPQHVTAAYLDKLEQWPRPTINNPESFVSFAAFLRQMVQTFILHNFTSDLQSSAVLKIAKDKLAPTMIIRWNEYVLRQAIVQPNLIHFKDWIDNYAEACEDLSTSQRPTNQENSSSKKSNRLFQQQSNKRCPLCGYSHNLGKCNQFLNKDINERQQTVRQLKICPNCLTEHPKGQCNSHYRCRIENCNGFHHSTIHRNNFNSSQTFSPNQQQQRNQQQQHQQQTNNQVQNQSANNYHNNRGLQNNGHQTQITANRSQFQPNGFNYGRMAGYNHNNNTLPISSLYGEHIITSTEVLLGIGSLNSTRPLFNLPVYATSASDFQMPNVPVEMLNSICADYDHLNNITFPQIRDNRIGVLIGADAFIATVPLKFTTGPPGTPYGVLTQLGWTVTGPIPQKYKPTSNKQEINYNITLYNRIKNPEQEIENDMLQMFWTMEGKSLVSGKKTLTADDRKALETLKRTTCHNGSRYEIGLPWKDDTKLPNNYFLAKAQLQSLENRFQQEPDLFCRYNQTIEADIENGFVEETQRQPSFMNSQLWYLPHHPVEHKMKKKVRRVTNAASVYKGHSLNKALLTGPDLLCSLVGLLLRFRQYKIAVTGDIEAMFMQVAIRTEDQDALRFLWNKDGEETIFKYKRLIFGATCSPSCAIYILHRCAEDNKLSNPEAYSAIRNNFYMDDYLQSFNTTENAVITTTEVKDTLHKGGFKLTKFFSNDPNTVMKITGENKDTAIEQRILGQMWNAKEDIFIFKRPDLKLDVKSMQQRQLLSLAASLFDPLGIITPFSIRVRCILQSILKQGNNWNNQIPREFQHDLQQWVDEYEQMPEISISRCLIPNPDAKHELLIFCDASSTAIATTIYIRSTSAEEITTQYVVSKARVAPIKTTTIPKLELEAAAMGAELASFVRSEMTAQFDKIQFWTDSMATLVERKYMQQQVVVVQSDKKFGLLGRKILTQKGINTACDAKLTAVKGYKAHAKLIPRSQPMF
ncbi:uncharacterized protein LOC142357013, partial [Convolutriloba macropyga]|uniref:uncharacterized protein LOC142357013 n=1 Tax=Convolutriloba macropyga TaxID=536237 RepID=UPI003F521950